MTTDQTTDPKAKTLPKSGPSRNTPSQPAPINKGVRKFRPLSLPLATRPSPGMFPNILGQFDEDLKKTALGEQMYGDFVMTQTMACGGIHEVADAEDSVIKAENERVSSGAAAVAVQMHGGRPRAMPTRYEELAEVAERRLGVMLEQHEVRMQKHTRLRLSIMDAMDKAFVHPETARDTTLQAQIRDHIKTLGGSKAKLFAFQSARDGDRAAIHTLFTSPPYLFGLTAEDIGEMRSLAQKVLTPDLFKANEIGDRMDTALALTKKVLTDKRKQIDGYRMHSQKAATDALSKLRKTVKR